MKKTTNTPRPRAVTTTPEEPNTSSITRGQVEEIVDTMLRAAMRDQARNMEQHLKNIHERLVRMETHRSLQ